MNKQSISTFLRLYDVWLVGLGATAVSLSAFFIYFRSGLTTSYGDARAHLDIARRVFDNLTPGFAQLGGIWLPLPHLLMLPSIWSSYLWHSGISGSIISLASYVLSTVYTYKLIVLISQKRLQGLIGALVIGLNANFLYIQTTAMTEPLFLCTLIIAVYYLIRWSKTQEIAPLIISGFFFMLSTLNRYEAWPVAIIATVLVGWIGRKKEGQKFADGTALIFGTVACLGIFLWIGWQILIFHNPFYFLNSQYSAKGQTAVDIGSGLVPTYGSVPTSLKALFYALLHVLGPLIAVAAFGFIWLAVSVKQRVLESKTVLCLLLLLIPIAFLFVALYRGNIPLNVPEIKIGNGQTSYFNIRYALLTLPALAIAVGLLARNRLLQVLCLILLLGNTVFLDGKYLSPRIATLMDAQADLRQSPAITQWAHTAYSGGKILVSTTTADPLIFKSGLNMSTFITEGSGRYWTESMSNPAQYAKWIILTPSPRDMVKVQSTPGAITSNFHIYKNYDGFAIWLRNS